MAKKKGSSWLMWFPLVIGVVVTPAVVRVASVLVLSGPEGLALLYPWAALLRSPVLGVSAYIAVPVEQWSMYLQFPVYGLMMTWMMRKRGAGSAMMLLMLVHFGCVAVVAGLAYLQGPSLRIF